MGMDEQLQKPSRIQQEIQSLRKQHPDCVVVYFSKHKSAAESLPKPTKPMYSSFHPVCFSSEV